MVTRKFFLNLLLMALVATLGLFLLKHTVVVMVLAAALAVKHMAYILINGNIFQELRTYIFVASTEKRSPATRKVFRKLYVLFSCNLCMTTQLSIWTVASPVTVVTHLRNPHPLESYLGVQLPGPAEWVLTALAAFLFAMVIAALAMALWRITEFPQEYTESMVSFEEQKIALARAKFTRRAWFTRSAPDNPSSSAEITEADITWIFEEVHESCESGSYCRTVLRNCFAHHLPAIVNELAQEKGWSEKEEQLLLLRTVDLQKRYIQEMYQEYGDPARYAEIRQELAREFFAKELSTAATV